MPLDQYLKSFSRLRTDKNRKRWSALTTYQAPHKPFLLLSIMDLIAEGFIAKNFIEPAFELVDTFNTYWNSIMPLGSKTSMAYPFPRLKTDGFWHLEWNGVKSAFDPYQDVIISMPKWVTITVTNMSRKTMIMIGMIIGSIAGGYLPGLLGADAFSLSSLLGSGAGGILGIWIAFQLTR
jgi:hypothetical protein